MKNHYQFCLFGVTQKQKTVDTYNFHQICILLFFICMFRIQH